MLCEGGREGGGGRVGGGEKERERESIIMLAT